MRTLTRYLLFDFLSVFLVALTGMTVLMIVVGLAQEAIQQGLGPGPIVRLVPYVLPDALRFAVPATILLAASTVFGRMAASNEIVALKSLGISPMALLVPAWLVAFIMSLVAVWLNDVAVSWGRIGVHRVVLESVEQIAYGMLRAQKSYSSGNSGRFSISVKDVEGRRLIRPTFSFYSEDDGETVIVTAREAELRSNTKEQTLSVLLTDSTVKVGNNIAVGIPGVEERVIPLTTASKVGELSRSPSSVPLREISSEIDSQVEAIDQLQQELAAEAGLDLITWNLANLTDKDLRERNLQLQRYEDRLSRLRTEPWRRWAVGFSCLFFVMVGAPLAIHSRSANFFNNFAKVFLPVLVIYYPLLAYGVDRAKAGTVQPYTVWLGNLILAGIAFWFVRKVVRY